MRTPLHRGKDRPLGHIYQGRWRYGFLSYIGPSHSTITEYGELGPVQCEVIPESVGENTGLTDMDGTPIYEGDLLEDFHDERKMFEQGTHLEAKGQRFVVEWHAKYACFFAQSLGRHDSRSMSNAAATCKVVGNTTDNPLPKPKKRRYSPKRKKPL